ncbi:hypothetical protein V2J09_016127 [Rumex salicifolius]
MDIASLEKFPQDHIKLGGKAGALGDSISATPARRARLLTVISNTNFIKRKILKGSSNSSSEGCHYHGYDGNQMDQWRVHENEEIDCAIALSLAEEEAKKSALLIPSNGAGLIEYRAHPFWGQKYCPVHDTDGTPRCCSCERMEPQDSGYISLGDGRKLCLECLDSSVMDTNQCQPQYLEIQEFYESLGMKIQQQVPLLLVERQALNEAMGGEKHVTFLALCKYIYLATNYKHLSLLLRLNIRINAH